MNFKNLKDLFVKFSSEEICRKYLEQQRWPDGIVCPYCQHSGKIYRIEKDVRYKCGNPECHKKFSVTVGTIYESSKIPLSTWFGAMYLCTAHKKGISSLQLHRDLGVTQKTAWFMLHRIREMLSDNAAEKFKNTVEIDEAYIGGKEKNKHMKKKKKNYEATDRLKYNNDKTPVLGMVERNGNVYARKMEAATIEQMYPLIESKIEKGATIMTDDNPAYMRLDNNYSHYIIVHSAGHYAHGQIYTNTIEGFWSLLKRGIIGIYHSVTYKHLNHYCDEFTYRYNTRKISDAQRFHLSVKRAAGKRLKYKELTGRFYGLTEGQ